VLQPGQPPPATDQRVPGVPSLTVSTVWAPPTAADADRSPWEPLVSGGDGGFHYSFGWFGCCASVPDASSGAVDGDASLAKTPPRGQRRRTRRRPRPGWTPDASRFAHPSAGAARRSDHSPRAATPGMGSEGEDSEWDCRSEAPLSAKSDDGSFIPFEAHARRLLDDFGFSSSEGSAAGREQRLLDVLSDDEGELALPERDEVEGLPLESDRAAGSGKGPISCSVDCPMVLVPLEKSDSEDEDEDDIDGDESELAQLVGQHSGGTKLDSCEALHPCRTISGASQATLQQRHYGGDMEPGVSDTPKAKRSVSPLPEYVSLCANLCLFPNGRSFTDALVS
jgi:hypothetical protein